MAFVELRGIVKTFGGVPAVKGVDFAVDAGSVHALLGENGAGKSTLMKVLAGVHRPDAGSIVMDGVERRFANPRAALDAGVSTIHQEPSLCADLSVCDNLFLGRSRGIGQRAMRRRAAEIFARLGVEMPVDARVGTLSKARAQFVQIGRALVAQARVMIMDEPSASLTDHDTERLFAIVDALRGEGTAIVYISHRLDEIFRITDRITVMRDGERVATAATAEVDQDWIIGHMVGRAAVLHRRTPHAPGPVVLETRALTSPGRFAGIDLVVRAGEIVGMGGLVGAGRSDVAQGIVGLAPTTGSVRLGGEPVTGTVRERIARGIAFVPEDRASQGLVLSFPLAANATLAALKSVAAAGLIDGGKERAVAAEAIQTLHIRPGRADLAAANFSGGNQQKIVLGKWLATRPRLLILDEPTQGVDVGAKAEIHALIDRLAGEGLAILLISSDLQELLAMSDRVEVMYRGRIVASFPHGTAAEAVMHAASGLAVVEATHVA